MNTIDPKILDELSQKLAGILPGSANLLPDDLKKNVRAIMEASMRKMDLVSRQEFEVQQKVLARTREKLENLERQLIELEKNIG